MGEFEALENIFKDNFEKSSYIKNIIHTENINRFFLDISLYDTIFSVSIIIINYLRQIMLKKHEIHKLSKKLFLQNFQNGIFSNRKFVLEMYPFHLQTGIQFIRLR